MTRSKIGTVTCMLIVMLTVLVTGVNKTSAEEPQTRILKEQELVDMLVGSCIQSTRGC
ncbi:uncharacterized protein METZ01_LOCUS464739, partial [marine metagenome]